MTCRKNIYNDQLIINLSSEIEIIDNWIWQTTRNCASKVEEPSIWCISLVCFLQCVRRLEMKISTQFRQFDSHFFTSRRHSLALDRPRSVHFYPYFDPDTKYLRDELASLFRTLISFFLVIFCQNGKIENKKKKKEK